MQTQTTMNEAWRRAVFALDELAGAMHQYNEALTDNQSDPGTCNCGPCVNRRAAQLSANKGDCPCGNKYPHSHLSLFVPSDGSHPFRQEVTV